MPDEPDEGWNDESTGSEEPAVAHDDIMKRLLNYQRNLREGASPDEAADAARSAFADTGPVETAAATEEMVDLSSGDSAADDSAAEVEVIPQQVEVISHPERDEERYQEPAVHADVEPAPEPEWGSPMTSEPELEPAVRSEQDSPSVAIPEVAAADEMTPGSRAELEGRLATLEERLQRLGSRIGELRRSFQDMAVAADERLAAMEDEVGALRREREDE